ncbi:MAG TPA: DUF4382 domain-containing protein [Longimicrobium sp.]|jgi:hypothetical protein
MLKHGKKVLLPLAALAIAACDGGGTGSDSARVTIRLHDAPGDLAQAWVKIDRIYFQGTSDADSLSGRFDLMSTPTGWIDLMTLSGGSFATLVNGVPVPAGSYSQLRFVVCDAYVVTDAGQVFATSGADLPAGVTATGTLQLPSTCSSGFKVKLPDGGITLENASTILSVDFDVSQSFGHQAGNSGRWVMHPVLSATEIGFSGGIGGTVAVAQGVALPTCGGAAVNVTQFVPQATAGTTTVSAVVNPAGAYSLAVAPGTYTMGYAPEITFTNGDSLTFVAAATPPSVTVASGGAVTSNYSITAATCH